MDQLQIHQINTCWVGTGTSYMATSDEGNLVDLSHNHVGTVANNGNGDGGGDDGDDNDDFDDDDDDGDDE